MRRPGMWEAGEMVEIIYIEEFEPSDAQVLSFFELLASPDQLEWDFEDAPDFVGMTGPQRLAAFRQDKKPAIGQRHRFWAVDGQQVAGTSGIYVFGEPHRRHCADLGFGVRQSRQR